MYTQINSLIWENDFVAANRWTIPAGAIFFSLLVGLAIKYFHAPNLIEGKGAIESLKDGDFSGYKTFWGALFSSFFSLFSGASVGPEGSISFLDVDICEKLALKLKLAKESFLPASLVGLSSAYNGVVGNPAFAALFATETSGGKGGLSLLATNLAAGVVGFLLFVLLDVQSFAGMLTLPPIDTIKINWVLWAIALGALGALLAAYVAIAFSAANKVMGTFGDRIILRTLAAGTIIGVVCYFIPELMFSGESSIHTIIESASSYGVPMLLLLHFKTAFTSLVFQRWLFGRSHLSLSLCSGHARTYCESDGAKPSACHLSYLRRSGSSYSGLESAADEHFIGISSG
jgi:H+/Cl- antiporter ClcA